jgi:hypothetical protein
VGLSLQLYARAAVLPAVIGAIPAAAACLLIRLTFAAPPLRTIAVAAMLVGGVYAAFVFAFGLDRDTRRLYLVQLRGANPLSYAPISRVARTRRTDD